jgi:hypothetical protein
MPIIGFLAHQDNARCNFDALRSGADLLWIAGEICKRLNAMKIIVGMSVAIKLSWD